MTASRRRALLWTVAAPLVAAAADAAPGDPARDLKDKDFAVRMRAVEEIESQGGEDAEELLLSALGDKDWQVVERAATALGRRGTPASARALADLCTAGPVRRIRIAAARSLATVDAARGVAELAKKVNGDDAVRAYEAVAVLAGAAPGEAAKLVDDGLRPVKGRSARKVGLREQDPVRAAAALGLHAFPAAVRAARVEKLAHDPDVGVGAAALQSAIDHPDPGLAPSLVAALSSPKLPGVIERRLAGALHAIVAAAPAGDGAVAAAQPVFKAVSSTPTPEAAARFARLVGEIGRAPPAEEAAGAEPAKPLVPSDATMDALLPALGHVDARVRAAAAAALAKLRSERALDRAAEMASNDTDPRVRLLALRTLVRTCTATDQRAFKAMVERLADADPLVRVEAATGLGVRGVTGAIPSLEKVVAEAMEDRTNSRWALGTVALVSMGRTQDAAAVEPLRRALRDAKDWRLRAAAVVGLGRVQKKEAVAELCDALDAKEPQVRQCAFEFLRRLTDKEVGTDSKSWRAWWKLNEPTYAWVDREAEARKAKKYGYAENPQGVYEGLDVVVFQSRGDHIEDLLTHLKIDYRLTRAGQLPDAALHPFAVFVSNCTGEINDKDVTELQWFLHAGGYLFGSCWALSKTIERVAPGVLRKYETLMEVLDTVEAQPCGARGPYVEGVFDGVTRPNYLLYGAHLIEVLDPDRCEVLIDSPECATRWGAGDLAAWFPVGHGVVLDSVNHFDLQGFEKAEGLKTNEDRMAYAMDHLGLSYAEVREISARRAWDSNSKAAKEAKDLSAFRFISNFVRHKRRIDL